MTNASHTEPPREPQRPAGGSPGTAQPAAALPPKKSGGAGRIISTLLVLAAAAAGGAYYYNPGLFGGPPPAPAAAPPPPAVTVARPVSQQVTEWDEYSGQFSAVEYVEVRARVSGFLTEIHFTDGQIVKKGDLLFVIDPRPFEIALASAKAQLTQAQAQFDLATRQLQRAADLRQKDFVAQSTYDERLESVRAAQAAVDTAKAQIRSAELDLEFTHVTAPLSGRIGRHQSSIGNLVFGGNSGTTTLLTTIVSLDPIYFTFDMSEADYLAYERAVADGRLNSTRGGSISVEARLADETTWPRKGRLDFIDNQLDRGAGTIRARAAFANPDFFITPGQFGRLRLPGSQPYTALLVPDSAVVTDQSRKVLLTLGDDNVVKPKVIRPGPVIDGLRVIRSGIDPNDTVIINGLIRARSGAKVTPQNGKIEPEVAAN